jgi:hypothetical protein
LELFRHRVVFFVFHFLVHVYVFFLSLQIFNNQKLLCTVMWWPYWIEYRTNMKRAGYF